MEGWECAQVFGARHVLSKEFGNKTQCGRCRISEAQCVRETNELTDLSMNVGSAFTCCILLFPILLRSQCDPFLPKKYWLHLKSYLHAIRQLGNENIPGLGPVEPAEFGSKVWSNHGDRVGLDFLDSPLRGVGAFHVVFAETFESRDKYSFKICQGHRALPSGEGWSVGLG